MQNPFNPFNPPIYHKELLILSDRPTIICCFTTSKGFLTMLATTSAMTEAQRLRKEWSGTAARMVSQTQKKEKAQGKETIIWHENPLNLLLAIEVRFSPGEEPIILVLMVSRGYSTQSTVSPAIPPAIPCLISAIIIFQSTRNTHPPPSPTSQHHPISDTASIFPGEQLAELPKAVVEAFLLKLAKLLILEPDAPLGTDMQSLLQPPLIFRIAFIKRLHVINFLLPGLPQKLHIIIMQHPTLTLIIRYPNDTLHLATQDHLKNKVIIKCDSCAQIEVVAKNTKETVCKACGFHNKNCRKQNCNGELKLMMMATGMMVQECSVCDYREIVNMR